MSDTRRRRPAAASASASAADSSAAPSSTNAGSMKDSNQESFLCKPFYDLSLPLVLNDTSDGIISGFQRFCGVKNGQPTNKFFHYFFKIVSASGEEIFSLMPFVIWYDLHLGAVLVTHFVVILLLGQILKDLCRLPRPKNPAITRLESCFETEYGFPSTHTMSGFLPYSTVFSIAYNFKAPIDPLILNAFLGFAVLVGFSRLYLGVHSPFDITGGFILGFAASRFLAHFDGAIIETVYYNPNGIYIALACMLAFITLYPRPKPWRAGYGTASIIFGPWFGCATAFWFIKNTVAGAEVAKILQESSADHFQAFFYKNENVFKLDYSINSDMASKVFKRNGSALALFAISYYTVRAIGRLLSKFLLKVGVFSRDKSETVDPENRPVEINKAYCIEVPTRLLTFFVMGWITTVGAANLWKALKI